MNLQPVSRNPLINSKADITNYCFDEKSEAIITNWMQDNLGLSYYEMKLSLSDIEECESIIIAEEIPLLNISKNPDNPSRNLILGLRKECVDIVKLSIQNSNPRLFAKQKLVEIKYSAHYKDPESRDVQKYVSIWQKIRPILRDALERCINKKQISIQLDREDFIKVGNRKSFAFNIKYISGKASNNPGGSAVARDLDFALKQNETITNLLKNHNIKLKMNNSFVFTIERI